jgi:hypothetical protein
LEGAAQGQSFGDRPEKMLLLLQLLLLLSLSGGRAQ